MQRPTFLYHQLVRKCEGCGRVVPEASEDCPTCGRPWRCQVVDFETFRAAQGDRANTPASPANATRTARRTLVHDGPWARHFLLPSQTLLHTSKFQDRTATITLEQLQAGWPRWSPQVRREFTLSCSWLHEQDDFPDMLRFILVVGDAIECSHIASLVATWLPTEEAHTNFPRPWSVRRQDWKRTSSKRSGSPHTPPRWLCWSGSSSVSSSSPMFWKVTHSQGVSPPFSASSTSLTWVHPPPTTRSGFGAWHRIPRRWFARPAGASCGGISRGWTTASDTRLHRIPCDPRSLTRLRSGKLEPSSLMSGTAPKLHQDPLPQPPNAEGWEQFLFSAVAAAGLDAANYVGN